MMDALKDTHREAIIAETAANDGVQCTVLFGSRAIGANTALSEVDFALFGDRQANTALSDLDRKGVAESVIRRFGEVLCERCKAQARPALAPDSIDGAIGLYRTMSGTPWV